MVGLIENRLEAGTCDEVMEIAWSAMWNVTDETPQNCQRFICQRGMHHFLECLRTFPEKEELLRNMMGLIVSKLMGLIVSKLMGLIVSNLIPVGHM